MNPSAVATVRAIPLASTDAPDWCEWPISSNWRQGTCSRFGASEVFGGIRLCWQHEDAMWSEAHARIDKAPEWLIDALIERLMKEGRGHRLMAERVVSDLIEDYSTGAPIPREIADSFDEILKLRLASKWGAA